MKILAFPSPPMFYKSSSEIMGRHKVFKRLERMGSRERKVWDLVFEYQLVIGISSNGKMVEKAKTVQQRKSTVELQIKKLGSSHWLLICSTLP